MSIPAESSYYTKLNFTSQLKELENHSMTGIEIKGRKQKDFFKNITLSPMKQEPPNSTSISTCK